MAWHLLNHIMVKRLARLFTIKTRTEAFLVIYAIAVGAVERGLHYMQQYPGFGGYLLALCCTGVVFLAGGRLLDSVRPALAPAIARPLLPRRRRSLSRNRPRSRRSAASARSAGWFRKD